uniref:Uncharacterized protein n=1 Tax=Timema shepardi TaxID=629360 RepID=A0A7R9AT56_TIMSH|nr:unnamed protein product [Timema shepardi]
MLLSSVRSVPRQHRHDHWLCTVDLKKGRQIRPPPLPTLFSLEMTVVAEQYLKNEAPSPPQHLKQNSSYVHVR